MRPSSILLLAGLIALGGCARRITTPPPPASFDGHYFRFPTGLQLAVYEDPTAPRVTVTISYGVGALEDPPGQEGMAHLVEHLTGRAAAPEGASLKVRALVLGAANNAFTSLEETQYFAAVPRERVREYLAIEADRMRAPIARLEEADFLTERGVVKSELYERIFDDTEVARFALTLPLLFPKHPYGRSILGTESSLDRITLEDARRWTRSNYAISIAGNVTRVEEALTAAGYHPERVK